MNTQDQSPKEPKAYSYLRFSTPEQAKGDSLRRQTELSKEWASRRGITFDEELTFQDLGVSAFRGDNAETGKLGEFLEAVRAGVVSKGSYLLIESLDRLSRDRPRKAVRLMEDIVEAGITLVTMADRREYTAKDIDADPMLFLMAYLVAVRANEESLTKSKRLAAAWSNKRHKAAEGKVITTKIPSWLEVVEKRGERTFKINQHKAKIVKNVFKMAKSGMGQHAIAKKLNEDEVPTFGGSEFWHRSYIAKLLSNEAVIGTYIPNRIEHHDGRKVRAAQKPITSYFPNVVSKQLFESVQVMASHRPRGKAREGVVRNMLAGLAVCTLCGSSMTRVVKGPKGGRPKLVCTKAKAGAGCEYHAVDLDKIEEALVTHADRIVGEAPAPIDLENEIEHAEVEVDELAEQARNLADQIARKPSQALRDRLEQIELQWAEWVAKRDALRLKQSASIPATLRKRLETLNGALKSRERDKINAAFRAVMERIEVSPVFPTIDFVWKHGKTSIEYDFEWDEVVTIQR